MKNPRSSSYEQFCFISPLAFCHIFKVQFSLDHIIKFLKYLILEQNSLFFFPQCQAQWFKLNLSSFLLAVIKAAAW